MKSKRTIKPGEPGSIRLLKKYGNRLVCVRYRYDEEKRKRYRTVELIEEENTWFNQSGRIPFNKIMKLKVGIKETHIQRLIRNAGGRWNRKNQCWELSFRDTKSLGLENRII